MSEITAPNAASGQQLLTAALAKNNQQAQGKMALALIEAAVVSQPAATPKGSNPNIGSHINIKT